jgi:phosphoglycolate phosphatase-like HAD superfamily hydrolase
MDKALNIFTLIEKAKIIFWDFDGVIKDSVRVKIDSFCQLFEPYGSEIVEKVRVHNEQNGGMSRLEKFPIYLSWVGEEATESRIKELSEQFKCLVLDGVIHSNWIPGVEDYLRSNIFNQKFILVSATPKKELDLILKRLQLENIFLESFGAPDSKITGIRSMLALLKVDPKDTVMIGDSIADKNAADACIVPFVLKRNDMNRKIFENYLGYTIDDFTKL